MLSQERGFVSEVLRSLTVSFTSRYSPEHEPELQQAPDSSMPLAVKSLAENHNPKQSYLH